MSIVDMWGQEMAQHQQHHESASIGEIDDDWIERLRHDPDVFVYRRATDTPFVPALRVTEPIDVLWLLGRGCTDEEESVRDRTNG